ncbi:MAG TPA: class D beta-lactamase [Telmatospirillum sp.]|nr:class D beta-lactamase [Telmatospirillum sp.]
MADPACTLLVEAASGKVLERQGSQCETRNSPASTFKIALAVMGYDAGLLHDAHTPAWPYQDDYEAWMESWKNTIDPTSWLRESVVWYSREITRRLGSDRFQQYVDRLDYGNRDLSGDPGRNNGLANAWLSSSLAISPAEEITFLRNLLTDQLPVSNLALARTISILPRFPLPNGWTAHGKTGTGFQPGTDGQPDRDRQFGWFVGWAQKGERRVAFARLIKDERKIQTPAGWRARDGLLGDLPPLLGRIR